MKIEMILKTIEMNILKKNSRMTVINIEMKMKMKIVKTLH